MESCKCHSFIVYNSESGNNRIQNFHLGRYINGYKVGNLVLRQCLSGALKHKLMSEQSHKTKFPAIYLTIYILK